MIREIDTGSADPHGPQSDAAAELPSRRLAKAAAEGIDSSEALGFFDRPKNVFEGVRETREDARCRSPSNRRFPREVAKCVERYEASKRDDHCPMLEDQGAVWRRFAQKCTCRTQHSVVLGNRDDPGSQRAGDRQAQPLSAMSNEHSRPVASLCFQRWFFDRRLIQGHQCFRRWPRRRDSDVVHAPNARIRFSRKWRWRHGRDENLGRRQGRSTFAQ